MTRNPLRAGRWMKFEFKKLNHSKIIWTGFVLIIAAIAYVSIIIGLTRKSITIKEDEYAVQVTAIREKITDNAEYLLSISRNNHDKAVNKANIRYYQRKLNLSENEDWALGKRLLIYDNMYIADGIAMIMFTIAIVYLIVSEHGKEVFVLNFSSQKGRCKLYGKKLAVIGICAALTVILEIGLVNLISVFFGNGVNWNEAIQQNSYAKLSPYSLNYLQYTLCITGMKILGFIVFSFFIAFIASMFTRIWIPLFIGISYSIGRIVSYVYITENSASGKLVNNLWSNIRGIMQNYSTSGFTFGPGRYLTKFEWNVIGNTPVFSWTTVLVVGFFSIFILGFSGCALYSRRSNRC